MQEQVIINKKVVKIIDRRKNVLQWRSTPKDDYLKYYRIIKIWAMKTYKINSTDLEIMYFLYSERLFTYRKFIEFCNIMSWEPKRFLRYREQGLIHVYMKPAWKEPRMYEMTYKGRRMINSIYKKMNGLETIPVSPRRNPIMKPNGKYSDKVMAMAILNFNSEVRARQQRLALE
jgi:hypothetical protein